MQFISLLLYNISIRLYALAIGCAAVFNAKAKWWVEGRRNQKLPVNLPATGGKTIWVHCASLGEFEQARPVIEKIKTEKPATVIVLTFFSPSGYQIRKNYSYADAVLYLPIDTATNARLFIEYIKPDLALFVKYEFWHHYLSQLKTRKIPTVLFSAIFRPGQVFFKWYGGFFKNMLGSFDKILVQNKESQDLLKGIGITAQISFDTRFDRVFEIAQAAKSFPLIEKFKGAHKILIAGSTWPKDEQLLTAAIAAGVLKNYKYIIAPHNLHTAQIEALQKALPVKSICLSQLTNQNATTADAIIVDTMGDLSALYRYGDIAYVGGAFNASVHNVLEPAVYGQPVIFGPHYQKSAEAKQLLNLTAAFTIADQHQLQTILTKLHTDNRLMQKAAVTSALYVRERLGGVQDIWEVVAKWV